MTANAGANVVQGLIISETTGINFGDISESGAGTVIMSQLGGRSVTGGADVLSGGTTPSQGIYTISGEAGKAYTLTLPVTVTVGEAGGDTMDITAFNSDASNSAVAAGETVNIGATIGISAGQATGTYSATYPLTVNYN